MSALLALHPCYLAKLGVISLKLLHLVSTEACSFALAAVKSCDVYMGERGDGPSPVHMVRLMEGAKLTHLNIT